MSGIDQQNFTMILVLLPVGLALVVAVSILGAVFGHRGGRANDEDPAAQTPQD